MLNLTENKKCSHFSMKVKHPPSCSNFNACFRGKKNRQNNKFSDFKNPWLLNFETEIN